MLCEVGLSIQEALKEISKTYSYKNTDKILDNILLGMSLNTAFENANLGLTKAELTLIKMAENTGKLSEVFLQIAKLREKSTENDKRLQKALRYPLLVFFSTLSSFIFLMLFVIPNFKDLFENLGANLPLITKIMLQIYDFLQHYAVFALILFVFILFFIVMFYRKLHFFAYLCDSLILKIPIIAPFIKYHQNYYFFMIFALLLQSGIPFSKSFYLAIDGIKNKKMIFLYQKLFSLIDSGLELSVSFKKIGIFDSLVISMLNIAMKSSKLEFLSEEISKYYEKKIENFMDKFLVLLEPLMTLFVAILVLFLALGVFLPMWELSSNINL